MKAIPDSYNYRIHELVAAELETWFGHQATERALTRDKETLSRPEPRAKDWETFRAQASKIDPAAMKAELTALWNRADSGQAFAAALHEQGYILAKGDKRDFCVIDHAGDEHSLARRIAGVKAAGVRERMADVDRDALPSVTEARELARQHWEDAGSGGAAPRPEPLPAEPQREEPPLSPFDAVLAETMREATRLHRVAPEDPPASPEHDAGSSPPLSDFEAILAHTVREATAQAARQAEAERSDGGRFARWSSWLEQALSVASHWKAYLAELIVEGFHHAAEHEPDRGPER